MSRTRGVLLPRERAGKIQDRLVQACMMSRLTPGTAYPSLGESLAQPKRPCAVHQRADRCWRRAARR